MAEWEVVTLAPSTSTLFRGNTLLSKSLELYMRIAGADWLEASIGETLRTICTDQIEIEIDPSKTPLGEKDKVLQDQNVVALNSWATVIWDAIYASRHRCPR